MMTDISAVNISYFGLKLGAFPSFNANKLWKSANSREHIWKI